MGVVLVVVAAEAVVVEVEVCCICSSGGSSSSSSTNSTSSIPSTLHMFSIGQLHVSSALFPPRAVMNLRLTLTFGHHVCHVQVSKSLGGLTLNCWADSCAPWP